MILASDEFLCQSIFHDTVDNSAATGVSIKQTLRDMYLEYCILGKKEVRY